MLEHATNTSNKTIKPNHIRSEQPKRIISKPHRHTSSLHPPQNPSQKTHLCLGFQICPKFCFPYQLITTPPSQTPRRHKPLRRNHLNLDPNSLVNPSKTSSKFPIPSSNAVAPATSRIPHLPDRNHARKLHPERIVHTGGLAIAGRVGRRVSRKRRR